MEHKHMGHNSLFINTITFFFQNGIYRGSFIYTGISTLSDFISKALKASCFRGCLPIKTGSKTP